MGMGEFRTIVRGSRSGCAAFVGSLIPNCYDYTIEQEGPVGDGGWEALASGTTKYPFFCPEYGSMRKYRPIDLPDGAEAAKEVGIAREDALSMSIQARSTLFAVEVLFTQTDDEDREEEGDKLTYVHYVRGERQDDCYTDAYPKSLWMPVGGYFD